MAWVEVLFEEVNEDVADASYNSDCNDSYTYVAQRVTGSLDPTVRIEGIRVTFNTGINPFHYGDTGCVWWDDNQGVDEVPFYLTMKVFGPELDPTGEDLYIDIDFSHVAELEMVAAEPPDSIFNFLSAFEFTFYKRDVLTGSFVTSVEFDRATAAGFWTDYKDTREVC